MADLTNKRLTLRANDYDPLPAYEKEVFLPGWAQKTAVPESEIASWATAHPRWKNTGLNTSNCPAVDIDITHQGAADAIADCVRDWFDGRGDIITRFGAAPKRAILLRTGRPFAKLRMDFIDPAALDPNDEKKGHHHIEILGNGQQIIVDGIHPGTKKPYAWHADRSPLTVPRSELPEITEQEATKLLTHISDLLSEQFGFQIDTGTREGTNGGGGRDGAVFPRDDDGKLDVEAAMAAMTATGPSCNDIQPRIVLSMLQRGVHPDDVTDWVVDETMKKPTPPTSGGLTPPSTRASLSDARAPSTCCIRNTTRPAGLSPHGWRGSFTPIGSMHWSPAAGRSFSTPSTSDGTSAHSKPGRSRARPTKSRKRKRRGTTIRKGSPKSPIRHRPQAHGRSCSSFARSSRSTPRHCQPAHGCTASTINDAQ
jgi:hypothetical protein